MALTYRTIGDVNINSGGTVVNMMDKAALMRIRELERLIDEQKARIESLEKRARAAEAILAHQKIASVA